MITKVCTKCFILKDAISDNFNIQKGGKYNLNSQCKDCLKAYRKIYTSTPEYKERHRLSMIKYRSENPEKTLAVNRKNYRLHGKEHNAKRKHRYHNDPEYRAKKDEGDKKYRASEKGQVMIHSPKNMQNQRDRNKKHRKKNKEKIKIYSAKYRDENKDFIHGLDVKRRLELSDSYVASSMRISVKDLHPETIQTKRLIIKLKRELKQ